MTYTTTIAKVHSIVVPFADMPKAAQEKIIAYGCQRIFNDMVGGAERFPTVEDKVKHVEAQIARFLAGDIGRAASAGVSQEVAIGRSLIKAGLKAKYGAKSPEWAAFTGLSDDEQEAKLDALLEKNKAKLQPQIDAEVKRRAELAAKRAKQSDGLELSL
jgi:hypothetical protein